MGCFHSGDIFWHRHDLRSPLERRVDQPWLLFFFVGLLPQLIDGALGMAFGVTATTVMLSFGTAPAQASAIVHFAEIFTTAASGASSIGSPPNGI